MAVYALDVVSNFLVQILARKVVPLRFCLAHRGRFLLLVVLLRLFFNWGGFSFRRPCQSCEAKEAFLNLRLGLSDASAELATVEVFGASELVGRSKVVDGPRGVVLEDRLAGLRNSRFVVNCLNVDLAEIVLALI